MRISVLSRCREEVPSAKHSATRYVARIFNDIPHGAVVQCWQSAVVGVGGSDADTDSVWEMEQDVTSENRGFSARTR